MAATKTRNRKGKDGGVGATPLVHMRLNPSTWARFCELVAAGKRTAQVEQLIREFNLRNTQP